MRKDALTVALLDLDGFGDAVSVVTLRKQSGANVTHAYFARPMLMRMVVPTASATAASS